MCIFVFVKAPFLGCVSIKYFTAIKLILWCLPANAWQVLSPLAAFKVCFIAMNISPNVCAAFLAARYKLLIWLPLFLFNSSSSILWLHHLRILCRLYSRNEFPLNFAANDVVQSNTQPYKYAKHKWNGMLWNLLQQWNFCSTHHTRWVNGISNCNKIAHWPSMYNRYKCAITEEGGNK